MIPEERRQWILRVIDDRSLVRADELAEELQVSVETVRRDLTALHKSGHVRRVYGGAARANGGVNGRHAIEPPYEDRQVLNLAAKQAMAQLAASLARPGETLIFDVGTSVLEVARALPQDFQGRALTNSLFAAIELAHRPELAVHVAGGELRPQDMVCSGPDTATFFAGFYADRAFLGSGGVHPRAGLTDYYPNEVAVRQLLLDRADEIHVLADSTKLGQVALRQVCGLDQITSVITDSGADPSIVAQLGAEGVQVLVAS
jgi:DeoR family fructose operon transcriptional repressor